MDLINNASFIGWLIAATEKAYCLKLGSLFITNITNGEPERRQYTISDIGNNHIWIPKSQILHVYDRSYSTQLREFDIPTWLAERFVIIY